MSACAKTILVTGAGSGIGRDSVWALAKRGHRVIATTLTEVQAVDLRARSQADGLRIEVFKMDITCAQDRELVLPLELDVLINNAGIGESGSLAEVEMSRIRRVFEVNVFATLELTQLALRSMIRRKHGTVLLISSVAGRLPVPFLMPYSMSKFALSAAGAGLRSELEQLHCNVHVSLIEPGAFHTGFNQAMAGRKYEWMNDSSYFINQKSQMQAREERMFNLVESKDTASIVARIVTASEARRPKLRYVAPWAQGLGVRLARIFGA